MPFMLPPPPLQQQPPQAPPPGRPLPPPPVDMGQLDERGLPPMSIEEFQAQMGPSGGMNVAPTAAPIELPAPPGAEKESFLKKIAPYLPALLGAGIGLASKGGSGGQAFGTGMAAGGSRVLLDQNLQRQKLELEQEQNLIENVNKRIESIRRIADPQVFDPNDPRHVAAKQILDRYASLMVDNKLTAKEATNLQTSMDRVGNWEQMLSEADQKAELRKAETLAQINDRIKRSHMQETPFGLMNPDDVARLKMEQAAEEGRDRRFNESQNNMFERQERMFNDLRERPWNIPMGTQQELSAAAANYTNLHTLAQAMQKTPTEGPVLGQVTLAQAERLGGAGLDPKTLDLVVRLKRAVADQAFERGGKTLTPTELETYTAFLPAMTDTVAQAFVKARNAISYLKNSYASKLAVMPERQRQQIPQTLDQAAIAMARYGGTGIGVADDPTAIPPPPGTIRKQGNDGKWYEKVNGQWQLSGQQQ